MDAFFFHMRLHGIALCTEVEDVPGHSGLNKTTPLKQTELYIMLLVTTLHSVTTLEL